MLFLCAGLGQVPRPEEEGQRKPDEGPGAHVQLQSGLEPAPLWGPGRPRAGPPQRPAEALRGLRRALGEDRPHLQVLTPGLPGPCLSIATRAKELVPCFFFFITAFGGTTRIGSHACMLEIPLIILAVYFCLTNFITFSSFTTGLICIMWL